VNTQLHTPGTAQKPPEISHTYKRHTRFLTPYTAALIDTPSRSLKKLVVTAARQGIYTRPIRSNTIDPFERLGLVV
jgi:hypothetical protein